MRLIRGRRAWFESVLAVSVFFAVLACNGDKPIGTERPAEHDLPVEGSIMDLGDFKKFLDAQHKGDVHERDRNASRSRQRVKVDIQSIGLTTDIKENQAPANDRVVARFENKDQKNTTSMYGMQPRDKADYYMWIHGGKGPTRWTIVELQKQSGGKAKVHLGPTGTFALCANHDPLKSEADFRSCNGAHPPAVNKSSLGGLSLPGRVRSNLLKVFQQDTTALPEDPAWLRCANGCCTARQTM
jgi:hypothetical protein